MAKKIALFNHKGGVSKTTTTFNLGWMLASMGLKTILVDTDPQCNLTGLVLGYDGASELENFFESEPDRNIKAGLAPAFESRPKAIQAVDCVQVKGVDNLYLLPGHVGLAEYEVTLGFSQELTNSMVTLQNLPGSINFLLDETAKAYEADYVLIDMSPSVSAINQNIMSIVDYFIIPTSPDYFSVMAIDSLSMIIPRWRQWSLKAQGNPLLLNADYPFPVVTPKFLGSIVQNFRPRRGEPAAAFKVWMEKINLAVNDRLLPSLEKNNMLIDNEFYSKCVGENTQNLAAIPDFNTLIALSQQNTTPIYALTEEQLGFTGPVLVTSLAKRDEFKTFFTDLAEKIICLTNE